MKIDCHSCGNPFDDTNYKSEYGDAVRIYCNDCVDEMWGNNNERK